jgi:hypothetical protein
MKNAIINKEDDTIGGLLDSYVAGYWAQNTDNFITPLADPQLRVGTVFDHQFAYGFVIASDEYKNNEEFEKCTRKKLNSMETKITKIIQQDAKTMEVGSNYCINAHFHSRKIFRGKKILYNVIGRHKFSVGKKF